MNAELLLNGRKQTILKIVNEREFVTVRDLLKEVDVSEATIRRDLDELSAEGLVGRVHGGAIKLSSSTTYEPFHDEKKSKMTAEKERIAKACLSLIHEGDSIFLDSGTTTLYIAREIASVKRLTIVTDNLDIAYSVKFDPSSSVIFTGGLLRRDYSVVVGPVAENVINKFRVDVCFAACDAVDPEVGLFNANYLEIGVKQAIVRCGYQTVLVDDDTKFDETSLAFVASIDEFDCVVTDTGLKDRHAAALRKKNIELILA